MVSVIVCSSMLVLGIHEAFWCIYIKSHKISYSIQFSHLLI